MTITIKTASPLRGRRGEVSRQDKTTASHWGGGLADHTAPNGREPNIPPRSHSGKCFAVAIINFLAVAINVLVAPIKNLVTEIETLDATTKSLGQQSYFMTDIWLLRDRDHHSHSRQVTVGSKAG